MDIEVLLGTIIEMVTNILTDMPVAGFVVAV